MARKKQKATLMSHEDRVKLINQPFTIRTIGGPAHGGLSLSHRTWVDHRRPTTHMDDDFYLDEWYLATEDFE